MYFNWLQDMRTFCKKECLKANCASAYVYWYNAYKFYHTAIYAELLG